MNYLAIDFLCGNSNNIIRLWGDCDCCTTIDILEEWLCHAHATNKDRLYTIRKSKGIGCEISNLGCQWYLHASCMRNIGSIGV